MPNRLILCFYFIVLTTLTPQIPWFRLDTLIRLKQYRWDKAAKRLPIVLPTRRRHLGRYGEGAAIEERTYKGGGWAGGREEREGKGGREERVFVRSHISLAKIFYMWDQDGESSCPEVFFMCDVS